MKFSSNRVPFRWRILAFLVPILMLSSCKDDGMIWDMYPVNVNIYIQDTDGANLLSPSVTGSLYGKKIVVKYQGEEYELDWDANETRHYMPSFSGLTLKTDYTQSGDHYEKDVNKNYLSFGEFDGEDNQDISISLNIEGYPEPWEISVSHRIKWKRNKPQVTNTATLNGKEVSYDNILISL